MVSELHKMTISGLKRNKSVHDQEKRNLLKITCAVFLEKYLMLAFLLFSKMF